MELRWNISVTPIPKHITLYFLLSQQLDVAYASMSQELAHDMEKQLTVQLVRMERMRDEALGDMEWTVLEVQRMADAIDSSGEVHCIFYIWYYKTES